MWKYALWLKLPTEGSFHPWSKTKTAQHIICITRIRNSSCRKHSIHSALIIVVSQMWANESQNQTVVVVALHASPRTQLTGQIFPTPLKLETTSFFGKHQNWQRQMCLVLYYILANAFSIAHSLKRCEALRSTPPTERLKQLTGWNFPAVIEGGVLAERRFFCFLLVPQPLH